MRACMTNPAPPPPPPPPCTCAQPQEFIDAVLRDRLASLFSLLERRAAGQRPYIMVCGLARHIEAQERKQHRSDMRAGPTVGRRPEEWMGGCWTHAT